MNDTFMTLLVPPNQDSGIREVRGEGTTVITYDDEISLDRRCTLVGRPAGSECGNSCTCS